MARLFTEGFEDSYKAYQPWLIANNDSEFIFRTGRRNGLGIAGSRWDFGNSFRTPPFASNPTDIYMRTAVYIRFSSTNERKIFSIHSDQEEEVYVTAGSHEPIRVKSSTTDDVILESTTVLALGT